MIIHIDKSVLFTRSPDERFALEYGLPKGTWTEIWRRHKLLGYTIPEMCEYYTIKTGRKTTSQSISRWVWRSEVYSKVQPVLKEGVRVVSSEFFGEHEEKVMKELLKNLKSSVQKNPKTVV